MAQTNDRSDVSSLISLPQGGGALDGIGETFTPDLHTGTGNLTVPIALPPGRNDFHPDISLTYSTGNTSGPFGLGWQLSIPSIRRKTSRGVPSYDVDDVFILSGSEDLVPVEALETRTIYRPRTEGLFGLIEHRHDAEDDHWRVKTIDGLESLYGTPRASPGDDPAVIADPENREKVFAWNLTETRDPFGNRIRYEYLRDLDQEGPRIWDQLYLHRIQYADYTDSNGDEQFLVSITFEYEMLPERFPADVPNRQRVYPISHYRAGFEIRTRRRCKRIRVEVHPERDGDAGTQLVRTYRFTYLDEDKRIATGEVGPERLPHNGISLLTRIEIVGHDGETSLPPLEFVYTQFKPQGREFITLDDSSLPVYPLSNPNLELVDLFGNGLPDLLETKGTMRYWRNLGGGVFDPPREMREAPAGLALGDPGVQLIDANGDGRPDLLVTQGAISGYYPTRPGRAWDRRSFQRYSTAPSFSLEDPSVQLIDLDGDGVTDAIRSGARLACFFNDPDTGWGETRQIERRAPSDFPNVDFSDPRVRRADMSGDNLQDFIMLYDGHLAYWPNLGHGHWGRRISMQNAPRFPEGYDPAHILTGDVNGDGLADMIYVESGKVTLWINQSGNGWSDPITVHGTPPLTNADAVRLVDLLGTGMSGILWSREAGGLRRAPMHFLDFTGGVKPYLLAEMDNHIGSRTRVGYAPSIQFYLEDEIRKETRWKTTLPFPVHVVARVEAIDEISGGKFSTEYSYHHGYWDGAEREFRGFGRVDQRDTETFEPWHTHGLHPDRPFEAVERQSFSPPTERRIWFHQGPIGDEFGGWQEIDYAHEYWAGDLQRLEHKERIDAFLRSYSSRPGRRPSPEDRRIKRDALRALRGHTLRIELYALDGSVREDRPYTVTENAYGLREEARPTGSDPERKRIFFPHPVAQRTTRWERGDDPMTHYTFTDDYDDFGQPRQETRVAVPRRQKRRRPLIATGLGELGGDEINETRLLTTHTRTEYAVPDKGVFIHDRVAQIRTFQLSEPPLVDETDPDDLSRVLAEHAAAARDIHDHFRTSAAVRLMSHTLNHYDGAAFVGRDTGEVGPYGALTRSEALVLTESGIEGAYGHRRPAYLGGAATHPDGAPDGFGQDLGYHLKKGVDQQHSLYYADAQRQRFDTQDADTTQKRGVVTAVQDPLGHQTTLMPDQHWLLPARVVDPAGLETAAIYDYRVMQPVKVTYPNGNAAHFRYTPLGLLHKRFLKSRDGGGGTEAKPEEEFDYDFLAYERTRHDRHPQPIFIHRRRRIRHASDHASDETIESREYFDGVGRLIQSRLQAEELTFGETGDDVGLALHPNGADGPAIGRRVDGRVAVSPWHVYDNKGQEVERYEPFFATGWDYQPKAEAKHGHHATLFYDPRGELVRIINPDGSEQRRILGIPGSLETPDEFDPTPWESYAYDPNDLAVVSLNPIDPTASLSRRAPQSHHFTPTSTLVDALGRVICHVERNGPVPTADWHATRWTYDLHSNLLTVRDSRGRVAFEHTYDLLDNELRVQSIDAGLRTAVLDAAGNLIEYRDSKGGLVLRQYDMSNRLTHLWARDNSDAPFPLRERLIYGDDEANAGLGRETARQSNLLGQIFRHYDEAGRLEFERYDFKGNLERKARQVISNTALEDAWTVDWSEADAEQALDNLAYQTSTRYDALSRPLEIAYPTDVNGHRALLVPRYNRGGALDKVELDGDPYVEHIAYNAKGQRVLIVYGNDTMTRYAYDSETHRLQRLRTDRVQETVANTFEGLGSPLQDVAYQYDLAGNMVSLEERAPNSGIANQPHGRDRLVREFTFDPLYRLTQATGRTCRGPYPPGSPSEPARCGAYDAPNQPGAPAPRQHNAPELTTAYSVRYDYDVTGNLHQLSRLVEGTMSRRQYTIETGSNRLETLKEGSVMHRFQYDANGNLSGSNTERHYTWDHADRLTTFTNQPDGADHASIEARYLYDTGGKRIKKHLRRNGSANTESTVYIDGVFEHDVWHKNGEHRENNHLHIVDDQQRIARVRRGSPHPEDAGPSVQYHIGDHLGSSHMVVDESGGWINREEYFPYGETSFGSFARKRYRFVAKERDEESGLYYQGARYYAPWLARWVSSDPAGMTDALNLYQYAHNNPLKFTDPTGTESQEAKPGSPQNPIIVHSLDKVPERWREQIKSGELQGWYSAPATAELTGDTIGMGEAGRVESVGGLIFIYVPAVTGGAAESAGAASSSGATERPASDLDAAREMARWFERKWNVTEKALEGHLESKRRAPGEDLSRARQRRREFKILSRLGKIAHNAPGYVMDAIQVVRAENRLELATELAVESGSAWASAKAAGSIARPLLSTGPKGWIAYGVIVTGAAIAGSKVGRGVFRNLSEVRIGPVPGGRPGRDRPFDAPKGGAWER